MLNNYKKFLIFSFFIANIMGCETFKKLSEPKPLVGKDIHVYNLAANQVELRLKVSGLTSTMWVTAELVNNSGQFLSFQTRELLQFDDPECLNNQEFETPRATVLYPKERVLLHYTFRLHALQKHSTQYEKCKGKPIKFKVDGLLLNNEIVQPITLTIVNE
ncbi:MAG: hypothetical protein A2Z20_05055 [Bdellovibrionales bacterium RBG_16_40_8]|nr:MAG: hypothetical protein A2Z20_05055 [Bdellovibrionales bacterium RBG_16_40_8]